MSGRGGPVGQTNTTRVQLALLERLIDDAPDRDRDPVMSSAEAMQALRQSVRQELEALLNARRRWKSPPRELTELPASPLCYGIPDFAAGVFNNQGERDRLRLEIEATIRRFEPQFLSVRVHLVDDGQRLDASLRLRIEAVLHAEPAPEQVTFDTIVDTVNDNVRISSGETLLMSDSLLPYFNRELDAIRELANEFAEAYPKIASRLRLSAGGIDDPHVARLLDGVAFLAARVHFRLDDEFPELTDALLGALYPHYLSPIPSCMVARLGCSPDLQTPDTRPVGTELETEPVRGEALRYRTTAPVTLWPVEVENIRLSGLPIVAPANPAAAGAVAALRITLKCAMPDMTFAQLGVDRLRFFLQGPSNQTLPLYELLGGHVLSVAFADTASDPTPVIVPAQTVQPAGFGDDEALLPWSARGFSGFRLLTEYFAFPEKFLFIDIGGIDRKTLASGGNRLEIFIYLDRPVGELERTIGPQSMALGCVPIVNLFSRRCDPIPVSHMRTEYRVVPDTRRPHFAEVWNIERIRETRPDGSSRPWRPFYRLTEGDPDPSVPGGFYHITRRAAAPGVPGTEVFIAPHDPGFDPAAPSDATLSVDALCLNRDLPTDLPYGGGRPNLRLVQGAASVTTITPVTPPTTTIRPPLRENGFWRLISHLSLSHLSVAGGAGGADALKEVLRVDAFRDTPETTTAIEALMSVSSQPGTARAPGRMGAFCRGLDITLEFDPRAWQVGGLFLLASVLERFLALHATINSFTRTRAVLRGRPGNAENLARAQRNPRAGMIIRSAMEALARTPRRFAFDAAIRVLTLARRTEDPAQVARFRTPPGLTYPPADVLEVRGDVPPAGKPDVTVGMIGLTGPSGVLPRHYTDAVVQALRNRSSSLHAFLDMLGHRFVAFFGQAGAKYRPARAADAAVHRLPPGPDPISGVLLALTGLGTGHLADRVLTGTDPVLHYAGLFALRPRSAQRLGALVSDWLGMRAEVIEFAGAWLTLPPDQRTRIGAHGQFSELSANAAAGVRAWDPQARVILRIGPLDRGGFERLLPDRDALQRLVALVRTYVGFEIGFAINPVLRADAVPPLRLDASADPKPRLGWNTWLEPTAGGPRRRGDAADPVFEAEIIEAQRVSKELAA